MPSIVFEEAQIRSNKKKVATANLAQSKSQVRLVIEKKIRKFLYVNLASGALLIMKNSIMTMRTHRVHKI
jgi:hypothetical protein